MRGGYILKRDKFIFFLVTEFGSKRLELNQWAANGLWRRKEIVRNGDHWIATAPKDPLNQQTKPTYKKYVKSE